MNNKHIKRNDFLNILFLYRNDYRMNFLYFCTTNDRPKGFYMCVKEKLKPTFEFIKLVHSKNNTL